MRREQIEVLQIAVRELEEFRDMRDVDSPTFNLALALVKKAIDIDDQSTVD